MWRNRFGRGFGPVVWQITDDDDDDALVICLKNNIKIYIKIYTKTAVDYFYCNFSKHELMRSLMIYIM